MCNLYTTCIHSSVHKIFNEWYRKLLKILKTTTKYDFGYCCCPAEGFKVTATSEIKPFSEKKTTGFYI